MARNKVLIIGGAGFIGSHTGDELKQRGYQIRVLDNLSPKTHFGSWPKYLDPSFEKIKGEARDRKILAKALTGVDYVIHLAALMDLMPNFSDFFDTNVTSTALIYELIVANKLPIKKVVVASSQFVYGEGRWHCQTHGDVFPELRAPDELSQQKWDPVCPQCHGSIAPLAGLETHQNPPNQYAISKYAEELIALKIGRQYNIPSVAMRYSIVHGPRQSLKNAYSGALRIFALKLLKGEAPPIYEDGLMRRDFVSVFDVARANADVLENLKADYENFNVGGGKFLTILDLAKLLAKKIGFKGSLSPSGQFRVGDIRHAVSDISKLKSLGWRPQDSEEQVVTKYLDWLTVELTKHDYYVYLTQAEKQMAKAGVIRK